MRFRQVLNFLKAWAIILALTLTLSLPRLTVSAASPAVVTVSAPTQPVSHGQVFTVNINVQPNNAIAGIQFSLSFNPSLVSINSVTEGNLLNQGGANTYFMAGTINNTSGTLTNVVGTITTPGQTVSTSGTFAVITMTAGSASGTCPLTLSNVVVGDINGNSLSVSLVNGQVINTPPSITTNSLSNWTVGASYSQTLGATGGTTPYTWTIASGTLPAGLSLNPSGVISGTPTTAGGPTSITFKVTDSTGLTATKALSITINTSPSITTTSLPTWTIGVAYSQTLGATGGTTPYTWTIASGTLPAGLSLSSSGVISGTPTTAGGPTSITFKVNDSASATATKALSITINAFPSITTTSLPSWTVGVAYSQTLSVTGGTTPYTWTIASGTLPAGLSLNSSGVISGTPTTAAGPTSVTFQVTDSVSATATKALSITINAFPSITTSSLPSWTVGVAYSQTLSVTAGTTPYTWTIASGTLPAGLSLSSSGVISGTPTTAGGPTSITFKVNDSASATATKALSITINAFPSITTTSLLAWTVGVAYSQTLGATGGMTPYTWTIASGTLPAGLSLSSSGVISGTPTTAAGPTSITFKVTDSASATATKALSITINASPSITTSSLPSWTVGVAYSQTLSVTGGTTPYTWTIASGTLPAGLSLSSSGVISGTPTIASGPTSVTFQVTDTVGATATQALSITVVYAWDVNMDGAVNVLDMVLIGQHFGETGTAGWIRADVNADGAVNVLDLIIIGQHWTG